jgi:hypothetical protein
MYDVEALSAMGPPGVRKTVQSFEQACGRCEIKVRLDRMSLRLVVDNLIFDKSRDGSRGRCLTTDLPTLGLLKGDRVEPSREVPDIAHLQEGDLVTFWRPSKQTAYKHRCPLFGKETGLSSENLGVDWLHTLSLGVFQTWLGHLVWDLLKANVWSIQGSAAARHELGISCLREELFLWYKSEASQGRHHTRVQKLLPSMFGDAAHPACGLHGAETNSFLSFSEELLKKHGHRLGDRRVYHEQAGLSLRNCLGKIRRYPVVFPLSEIQAFCLDVQKHFWALERLGIECKPKHHLMGEMGGRFGQSSSYRKQ